MKSLKKLAVLLLVIVMLLSTLVLSASAAGTLACGMATVSADLLNIRSEPGTDASIVSRVSENEKVVILEKTNAEWYKINSSGTVGYVSTDYLANIRAAGSFEATGSVNGDYVRCRALPASYGSVITSLPGGTKVDITGINNGWYRIDLDGTVAYMRSDYVDIVSPYSVSAHAVSGSGIGVDIANFALQFVGYPYVYGAESPSVGFDCSGLVYYVFGQFGYSVTRTSSAQFDNDGVYISKAELQPGDLVFFSTNGGAYATHVGIFVGGTTFVHASTSTTGVILSDLDTNYYTTYWYGAKRVAQ